MRTHLQKLWPTLVTLAAGAIVFISPSVETYAHAHANYSVPILTVWMIFLHWAQSPRAK